MTAKPKKQFDKTKGILIIATGLLLLTLILLLSVSLGSNRQISNSEKGASVQLGRMEYDFSNGKVVKRIDNNAAELRAFLTNAAEKDISENCPTVHYIIAATSTNEDQILLHYGCYLPESRMFAVKQDGAWRFISPTNQFDNFGIPACSHVNENNIEATIAPVCVNGLDDSGDKISYETRT